VKRNVYINGIGAVTAQGVWHEQLLAQAEALNQPISVAQQPSYKELIAPAMIRRMSTGIKMGIYAAQQALDEADIALPDAIITGTGLGCLEDSEKFLKNILDNDEQFLTPTSFIQSTHNTVAAQIALRLRCKSYNFTYVHQSVSFESALLDGLLQLQHNEAQTVLVGACDEISDHTYLLLQTIGYIKANGIRETVKESLSPGVNYAEGTTFFGLSTLHTPQSYAMITDVTIQNDLDKDSIAPFVERFLQENGVERNTIDAVVVGINGDTVFDSYYQQFTDLFPQAPAIYYKHIVGQYDTSSAFGLAVAAQILKDQKTPANLLWNTKQTSAYRHVLLYNQFKGRDHSLILMKSC